MKRLIPIALVLALGSFALVFLRRPDAQLGSTVEEAREMLEARRCAEALALLDTQAEETPEEAEALAAFHNLRGLAALCERKSDVAIAAFDKAFALRAQLDPTGRQAVGASLAAAHQQKGDALAALVPLRTIVREVPGSAESHAALARGLLVVRRGNAALKAAQRAQRVAGGDTPPPELRLLEAEALALQLRRQEARSQLESLLKDAPELAGAWTLLAELQLATGELDAAKSALEKAFAKQPTARALFARAQLNMRKGQTREALRDFRDTLVREPRQPTAYYHQAKLRFEAGELDPAKATLGKLLKHWPGHAAGRSLKARIEAGAPKATAQPAPTAQSQLSALEAGSAPEASDAPPRALVVLLPGAHWRQLDPLMAGGKLPTLARLSTEGSRAHLRLPSAAPELALPTFTRFGFAREREFKTWASRALDDAGLGRPGEGPLALLQTHHAKLEALAGEAGQVERFLPDTGDPAVDPTLGTLKALDSDGLSEVELLERFSDLKKVESGSITTPEARLIVAAWKQIRAARRALSERLSKSEARLFLFQMPALALISQRLPAGPAADEGPFARTLERFLGLVDAELGEVFESLEPHWRIVVLSGPPPTDAAATTATGVWLARGPGLVAGKVLDPIPAARIPATLARLAGFAPAAPPPELAPLGALFQP